MFSNSLYLLKKIYFIITIQIYLQKLLQFDPVRIDNSIFQLSGFTPFQAELFLIKKSNTSGLREAKVLDAKTKFTNTTMSAKVSILIPKEVISGSVQWLSKTWIILPYKTNVSVDVLSSEY